jgi:hypothetical protein
MDNTTRMAITNARNLTSGVTDQATQQALYAVIDAIEKAAGAGERTTRTGSY